MARAGDLGIGLLLLRISCKDMNTREVDDRDLVFLITLEVIIVLLNNSALAEAFSASRLIVPFVLTLISLLTGEGLGFGDIKLLACLGLLFKFPHILTLLMVAMVLCGVYGVLVCVVEKKTHPREIPFTPFLFISFILMMV